MTWVVKRQLCTIEQVLEDLEKVVREDISYLNESYGVEIESLLDDAISPRFVVKYRNLDLGFVWFNKGQFIDIYRGDPDNRTHRIAVEWNTDTGECVITLLGARYRELTLQQISQEILEPFIFG